MSKAIIVALTLSIPIVASGMAQYSAITAVSNSYLLKHTPLESLPVETQIKRIFKEDARVALAVFKSESGLDCKAVSKTNDHGVAQLHNQPIYDCLENILAAKAKFDRFEKTYGDGFLAWTNYKNGKYLRFLN